MSTKWDSSEEDFLKKLERQCNSYNSYFMKDYEYYKKLSNKFNVPILTISSVNALCAISLTNFLEQKYVSILNAILSAGTGLLGSVQLYLKINEKMTSSIRSSITMKRIALHIAKELSIKPESRVTDGTIFVQECFADFNACLEQSNPIHRKFKNFMKLDPEINDQTSVISEDQSVSRSDNIIRYFRMAQPES